MNIDVSKNIDDALKYISKFNLIDLHQEFMYQTRYFKSEDFNETLNSMMHHLNKLYERTRLLEDVNAYARAYIKQNVITAKRTTQEILSSIEDDLDGIRNKTYITISVPLEESDGAYKDRDGTELPRTIVHDSTLTLSYKEKKDIEVKEISRKQGLVPYRENLKELLEDKAYRVFYMLDAPVKDGLVEEIQIDLAEAESINLFVAEPSNAVMNELVYTLDNDIKDYVETHQNVVQKSKKTKAINFFLTCDKYKQHTYYVDEKRAQPDFMSKLQEYEYNMTVGIGEEMTPAEMDELLGLKAFKEDYERYTKNLESWMERRQAVVDINRQNNYDDSMPRVDYVVPPEKLSTDQYLNTPSIKVKTDVEDKKPEEIFPDVDLAFYQKPSEAYDKLLDQNGDTYSYTII